MPIIDAFMTELESLPRVQYYGQVVEALGMMLKIQGGQKRLSIGDRCAVILDDQETLPIEIVGFREGYAMAMSYRDMEGIGAGNRVLLGTSRSVVHPSDQWLGRVINALAEPVDGKGILNKGRVPQIIKNTPPPAHTRRRLGHRLETGIAAINTFLPCCEGQRLGIFAGSGVGKSTMMGMLARHAAADIIVIGLIGERGREVQEFIQETLGEEGLKKSVLVVATSDESPLMRREAAYMTLAVAEYFRDQGKNVFCMMDSVTRFAMAQREIGLSVGEPPTTKGYPPTVFAELPKLLERAGPGQSSKQAGQGNITGMFTVLVEGGDTDEPISDAVRGILDGHIILDRDIAERGRYPSINLLKSVSRSLPACHSDEENALLKKARNLLSTYENMAELIRLGAYRHGTDTAVDEAIIYYEPLENFLAQQQNQPMSIEKSFQRLNEILNPVL